MIKNRPLVKMKSPLHLGDLPEVDLPTRFLFFYNGPPGLENQDLYTNIGIALAVAFTGDMPWIYKKIGNVQKQIYIIYIFI